MTAQKGAYLLAKNIDLIKKQLISASNSHSLETTNPEVHNSNVVQQPCSVEPTTSIPEDSSTSVSVYSSSDSSDSETSPFSLEQQLAIWSTKNNITHLATSELLKMLNPFYPSLPVDSRTLLNTPRNVNVIHCSGGSFIYFGLKQNLLDRILSGLTKGFYPIISKIAAQHNLLLERLLTITVNVDGLPIHESTTKAFWPILCVLDQSINKKPFIAGLFLGDSKPNNSNSFLQEFVNECFELETNGLESNNIKYFFRISCFIADAPAGSFLKNIVGHNSFHGCEKYLQEGIHFEKRTVWLYKTSDLSDQTTLLGVYYMKITNVLKQF